MAQIQEVQFPFGDVATELKVSVLEFPTSAASCSIRYSLHTEEGKEVYSQFYNLTEEEFEGWGQDNTYLDQLAADKIPVVIINEVA